MRRAGDVQLGPRQGRLASGVYIGDAQQSAASSRVAVKEGDLAGRGALAARNVCRERDRVPIGGRLRDAEIVVVVGNGRAVNATLAPEPAV